MADIQNQTLARLPTEQSSRLTLVFDGDNWNLAHKRLFGSKEVERRFFQIRDEMGKVSWFECSPALGDSIAEQVDKFIVDVYVDVERLEELDIAIARQFGGYGVTIISKPNTVPRISRWLRMVARAKSIFRRS